jgi:serine/threonine protein kinase
MRFKHETDQHCYRQLVLGISCLHSQAICHRDLKYENVLLASEDA